MPSGGAVELFNDYMLATGATIIGGVKGIQLEAAPHQNFISDAIQGDLTSKRLLQGGRSVRKHFIFRDNGTYGSYLPGEFRAYKNAQRLKQAESFFRYDECHTSWLEQEILQNEVATSGTEDVKYTQFASVRDVKKAALAADKWNGMQRAWFRVPDKTKHEGESNGEVVMEPMPLVAVINEATNGLPGAAFPGGAWTTKFGLDPTSAEVDGRFTNQIERYTQNGFTSTDTNSPIEAIDRIILKLKWKLPNELKQWRENEVLNKLRCITSMLGRTHLVALYRRQNDRYLLGAQDPGIPDPQVYGIPVQWSEEFQNGAYYPNAGNTALFTETDASAADEGPRYMFPNFNHLWPFFHREKYMVAEPPMRQFNVPDAWVMRVQVWWNWMCTSMQAQGIVAPTGDVI